MSFEQSRRGFIGGVISLIAAPAIVRVGLLMPVRVIDVDIEYWRVPSSGMIMEELIAITRRVYETRWRRSIEVANFYGCGFPGEVG